MTFIHHIRMAPDGRHLWVAAANEFDPGLKPGTRRAQLVIIDTKTDKVTDHIVLPKDIFPHDVKFSPDGKTALLSARTYGEDSELVLMNTETHKIEKRVSACESCHAPNGIKIRIDNGSPLLCGLAVNWNAK